MMKVTTIRDLETFQRQPRIQMDYEAMHAPCKNKIWDPVPHSPHNKEIGYKWIYKVKYNVDGSINRYIKPDS